MLSLFQANYQRMDQSLQRLTDSIAAYKPSTVAADELLASNEARNYQRIQELKAITASLDQTLSSTIQQLAERRKELAAIPSTDDASLGPEMTVADLLTYAAFISPTTVPATFRKPEAPLKPAKRPRLDVDMTNGIATPPPAAQDQNTTAFVRSDAVGQAVLSETDEVWLHPQKHLPFEPWPSHDVIQQGALADIQRIIESGRDPGSVLSAEELQENERKREEEEAREKREDEDRQRRRMSMIGRRRGTVDHSDVFDPDA